MKNTDLILGYKKIKGLGVYTREIVVSDWTLETTGDYQGRYKVRVNHNLKSTNLNITYFEDGVTANEICKIVDENNIDVYSDVNVVSKIIIQCVGENIEAPKNATVIDSLVSDSATDVVSARQTKSIKTTVDGHSVKLNEVTEQLENNTQQLQEHLTNHPQGGGGANIDDVNIGTDKVWSSSKTQNAIQQIPKGDKGDKGDPGTASVAINDSVTNVSQTWSSSKIGEESDLTNKGIVKGVFLPGYSFKGSIVKLPVKTTRLKIVKADGKYENPYGNWDKQEYDLSTGGGYLVFDMSDNISKQVTLPTKTQVVLFAYENQTIRGGYLYDSYINTDSPIVNIFNYAQVNKYPISYTKEIPSTVTFPSNYKFKTLHENGKGATYYISGSGQYEFTVNNNEKLICDEGIFRVVPLTYNGNNAINFLVITEGYINGGYLYELEKEKKAEAEPIYTSFSGDRILLSHNEDGSITLSNPLSNITYAKDIYIHTKSDVKWYRFNEDIIIPKGQGLVFNTITSTVRYLNHPTNDSNGFYSKLVGLTEHDVILAHNVNGKLVNGFFLSYTEKAREDILDIRTPSKFLNYHTKGSTQGICIIGEELWLCSHSNDEHTDFANISVINKNDFSSIRTISHNLGHLNTLSYNMDNDCLITTNSSKSYSLPPKLWIYPNWKQQSTSNRLDFNTLEKIELDFSWLYTENGESKANPVWGENIGNKNNLIYVLTNDNKIIRKVVLGKGTNNFGKGTFIDGKTDTEYNGTYKIVDMWSQFDGIGVNADVVFHKGKIYTAGRFTGKHSGCYVYQLQTGGNIKKSIIQIHNYSDNGTLQANDGQGLEIDGDNLYFFTDSWGVVLDINSIE